jgi:hypothetical protein
MDGFLIGINTAIYSRSGGSIGIGFAIPSNMVRAVLNAALEGEDYFDRSPTGCGRLARRSGRAGSLVGPRRAHAHARRRARSARCLLGAAGHRQDHRGAAARRTRPTCISSRSRRLSGVADLKKVFEEARARREMGQGTLLFVDEIHRFNRAQQDSFLPVMEDGTVTLVGATTENPSFELNAALLSRARVLTFRRSTRRRSRKRCSRAPRRSRGSSCRSTTTRARCCSAWPTATGAPC